MEVFKEDNVEPMELDNTNSDRDKTPVKDESRKADIPVNLIEEAKLYAEQLNARLKSLNDEDAQVFMKNFERNVVLLPKKMDSDKQQFKTSTSQTSEDFVMVNADDSKNSEDKHGSAVLNHEKQLFGTSVKSLQNSVCENVSSKMLEAKLTESENEKKDDGKNEILRHQQNYCTTVMEPHQKDAKRYEIQRNSNYPLHRSVSAERKNLDTNRHYLERLYSDAVKNGKHEHTTTFPTRLPSNIQSFYRDRLEADQSTNKKSDEQCSHHNRKPRSASNHATHRHHKIENDKNAHFNKEKTEYSFHPSYSKPTQDVSAATSRLIALKATQTQVANVTQQKNNWLEGNSALSQLQSSNKKSINILVLGQTGVGKSTWINAFANYLTFGTLEEAIAAEAPVCVIPTKFAMFDENYERHDILLGQHSNEVFSDKGQSATQNAKIYLFEKNEYDIYIIDTPGMEDTRGNDQDNENVQKILRAVAPFKELHAICFLFKANEARLTQSFKYCISKLLGNLSKSALKNVCFVFTNARGTFYKPGDTMSPLKAYFKELYETESLAVTINDSNTFCLDNEAFRFICAYFSKIQFGGLETKTYADSWKHSSSEMNRLLNHASRIEAHNTSETLSINETRTWILQLVNPIINVSGIIQTNLQQLEERIKELESMECSVQELQKRAAVPLTSLEIIHLNSPQTVCSSETCIAYKNVSGNMQPIYKTVCHKNCNITDGDPSRFPDPALKQCKAFNYKDKCKECGCHLKEHRRIFCEYRIVSNHLEVQAQQNVIASQHDAAKLKRKLVRQSEKMIDGYLQEFNFLLNAMAKFSLFLFQNGIAQRADIFEKHIERLVESEERMIKCVRHCDDKKYYKLVELLMSYRDIREKTYYHNSKCRISLTEIQDIRQKLFAMPITGSKIAEIFDIHVNADKHDYVHDVTRFEKKSFITRSVEWIKNLFG